MFTVIVVVLVRLLCMCAEMHEACVAGDLDKVKNILPEVRPSLNLFCGSNKENLLMW